MPSHGVYWGCIAGSGSAESLLTIERPEILLMLQKTLAPKNRRTDSRGKIPFPWHGRNPCPTRENRRVRKLVDACRAKSMQSTADRVEISLLKFVSLRIPKPRGIGRCLTPEPRWLVGANPLNNDVVALDISCTDACTS